ncbi:GFA family protein [Variovorax saccharolyticus]|uniref:GFA family protein n=1 Tax=Variovorax saccharolyticus TaxID=3053516 RepID=UPI00336C0D50
MLAKDWNPNPAKSPRASAASAHLVPPGASQESVDSRSRRQGLCACAGLRVLVEGEAQTVVACHCLECQRRTGSIFGMGAYCLDEQVVLTGDCREFTRFLDTSHTVTAQFCPSCGSTLIWRSSRRPGLVGVSVGAFADPQFPCPNLSVWEQTRHGWLDMAPAERRHRRDGAF